MKVYLNNKKIDNIDNNVIIKEMKLENSLNLNNYLIIFKGIILDKNKSFKDYEIKEEDSIILVKKKNKIKINKDKIIKLITKNNFNKLTNVFTDSIFTLDNNTENDSGLNNTSIIETSNIEIPNIEISNIEIPNIEIPNIEIPNIEISNNEISIDTNNNLDTNNLDTNNLNTNNLDNNNLDIYKNQIETLKNMGFDDYEKNIYLLKLFNGNLDKVVEFLLN